jgi:hypothetical protein
MVLAQDTTGIVEGVVHDLRGASLAGATVYGVDLSRMTDRNGRTTTTSDSAGRFVLHDMRPGTYSVHAYKDSDGHPDTFFSFFANNNKKAAQRVNVEAGRTIKNVVLELGPKYATLKLSIRDERGKPSGGSLTFIRIDDPKRPYSRGGDLSGEVVILVPATPFRFEIEKDGYEIWRSKLISPQSGQTVFVNAGLRRIARSIKKSHRTLLHQ